MKLIIRSLAFLLLLIMAPAAFGTFDYGDPAITRLWAGDRFACTASYVFPYINESMSWIVTAGHCAMAHVVKRDADTWVLGLAKWRAVLLGDTRYTETYVDLAVGTVPDTRDGKHKHLWLADEMPSAGHVYIHGFPAGVEKISVATILPGGSPELPGATILIVKTGEVVGGSSGSPVLSGDGRVVGILWGFTPEQYVPTLRLPMPLEPGYEIAIVTPVERLHKLMKLLGVKQPA